eukprot:31146-Pelagococcus_subviridis.AAC.5
MGIGGRGWFGRADGSRVLRADDGRRRASCFASERSIDAGRGGRARGGTDARGRTVRDLRGDLVLVHDRGLRTETQTAEGGAGWDVVSDASRRRGDARGLMARDDG